MKTTMLIFGFLVYSAIACSDAPKKRVTSKKEIMPEYKKTGVDLKAFLRDISYVESKGNHRVRSKRNMLGKYQFKWSTVQIHLKKWKMNRTTQREFLSRPSLQDSVMLANMQLNEKILKRFIKRYENKTVDGIKITKAGILAGAQFGPGTVIEFFKREGKYKLRDSNGVHVKSYMKHFSKYKLPKKIKI